MFRLQLFGRFQAFDESGEVIPFKAQSSSGIVVLLFLRKGRSMSREEMAEIIWPDSTQSQQRTNLRKAISRLPDVFKSDGIIRVGPDDLSMDTSMVTSDLEVAEHSHRQYLQNRDSDGAPAVLEEFWNVIRTPMLDGWDQPYFEALRTRYGFWADEVGAELAEAFEDRGQWESARMVWRKILEDSPSRMEAIKGLMRCETELHGRGHAQAVVHQILPTMSDSVLTSEVRKIIEAQKNQAGVVPSGELFRKRGPILLLVNLFEKNLQRGGEESLGLLAAEVDSDFAIQHPKVFLSLIDTSLANSSGWTEVRKTLMSAVLRMASRSCEFEIGHFWADEAIERGPQSEMFVAMAMAMKAFLYFEERDYARSEVWFERAARHPMMQIPNQERSTLRAMFAGLLWQQARFDQAISVYSEEVAYGESLRSEVGANIKSRALTNLSYIAGARHQWDRCVEFGEEAISMVGPRALNSMVLRAPLGSAKVHIGRIDDGLKDIVEGLSATAEAGMKRYHQVAFDYAATSLASVRGTDIAQRFVDANLEHRLAQHHFRSPAEVELLNRSGLADRKVGFRLENAELSRQSPATLNKFLVQALQ